MRKAILAGVLLVIAVFFCPGPGRAALVAQYDDGIWANGNVGDFVTATVVFNNDVTMASNGTFGAADIASFTLTTGGTCSRWGVNGLPTFTLSSSDPSLGTGGMETITLQNGNVVNWAFGLTNNLTDPSNPAIGSSTRIFTINESAPMGMSSWAEADQAISSGCVGATYVASSNSSDWTLQNAANSVPVPATLLLFGPGIIGLASIRRRFGK